MKLLDVDWQGIVAQLPRWSALSREARRLVLAELKTQGYVARSHFGAEFEAIRDSGLAVADPAQTRLSLSEEYRSFVKVLRAMHRHPIFDHPATVESLVHYMEEHFSAGDIERIGSRGTVGQPMFVNKRALAPHVAFAGWVGDLLDASSDDELLLWATDRGTRLVPGLVTGEVRLFRSLQKLAKRLLASPNGIPLTEFVSGTSARDLPGLAAALHEGLGKMVLFASMRDRDFEPMIGLWPPAAHELVRPPAGAPRPVKPVETFTFAIRMEDMTTLMAAIAASPVRLRANDRVVFARAAAEIEARLVPLPEWTAPVRREAKHSRVDEAAAELELNGFVAMTYIDNNPHLHATDAGARWLALTPHDRLDALVTPIRNAKEENPVSAYESDRSGRFFPLRLPFFRVPKSLQLRTALTQRFLTASKGFLPLEAFISHASREANPFLALPHSPHDDPYGFAHYGAGGDPRQAYRQLWEDILFLFFLERLLGLGGATLGRLADGALAFSLTDVGRYLLGAGDSFAYGSNVAGDVVFQPNFDVVFLGAAPSIEAVIARFAERVGPAPGLAFRITRQSVLVAAESGMAPEELIGAMSKASTKPVPKNVEREVAGWMAAVRRARLRVAHLVECSDEEAASRVAALLGPKARRLTPTIFELPASSVQNRSALLKRLKAGGVFLDLNAREEF